MDFEVKTMKLGKKTIKVEIAKTDAQRNHGLMFRKSLGVDEGMLFVFNDEIQLSFWMKNTLIPLSIGFFNNKGVLLEVLEMVPETMLNLSPKLYKSSKKAKYALEMNKNWFKKNKVKPGQKLNIEILK